MGAWCNGSTRVSESLCLGSTPSAPANCAAIVYRSRTTGSQPVEQGSIPCSGTTAVGYVGSIPTLSSNGRTPTRGEMWVQFPLAESIGYRLIARTPYYFVWRCWGCWFSPSGFQPDYAGSIPVTATKIASSTDEDSRTPMCTGWPPMGDEQACRVGYKAVTNADRRIQTICPCGETGYRTRLRTVSSPFKSARGYHLFSWRNRRA
jgi:hypothetical protein